MTVSGFLLRVGYRAIAGIDGMSGGVVPVKWSAVWCTRCFDETADWIPWIPFWRERACGAILGAKATSI